MIQGAKFLLPAIWKTVILPPLLAYWLLRHLKPPTDSFLLRVTMYLVVLVSSHIFRTWFSTLQTQIRARQCGAREVPRVKGRWVLNLDVMVDWSRSGREEEVARMLELLKREYGTTFNTRVLGEDQVITTDPRVIRHVLIDDFDNFVKGEKFYQRAEGFLGDGIFNSDGERWRFHRNLTRPYFHPSHISPSLFTPLFQRFMRNLPLGTPFDIHRPISRLALHVSLLWLCGCDLSGEEAVGDQLGEALRTAQEVVGRRVKIGTVWPLFELGRNPLREPMQVIRGFFRPLIARAKDKNQRREGHCLLYQLVDSTDDAKLVEDQLINLLLASRDTTASLSTFLVYALAIHPTIARQVRGEVRAVAGSDGQVDKDVDERSSTRHFGSSPLCR
ncbi:cytochrome P450 [Papiliotrema laurentii]|uniref:Cytochrome P450 n=1 Tax=Papiliotrema laurentii TaxID=5418 RepID=A0AAD9L927_PAPLA|nr:cytochrome P450 [Papiliotrema laurentii]